MPSNEDRMQRKADGTYTVTVTDLTLDEALSMLNTHRAGRVVPATALADVPDAEVHYRG